MFREDFARILFLFLCVMVNWFWAFTAGEVYQAEFMLSSASIVHPGIRHSHATFSTHPDFLSVEQIRKFAVRVQWNHREYTIFMINMSHAPGVKSSCLSNLFSLHILISNWYAWTTQVHPCNSANYRVGTMRWWPLKIFSKCLPNYLRHSCWVFSMMRKIIPV